MRLFYAINFDDTFRAALSARTDALRTAAERGRFTRPENLHLTLAFLGETPRRSDAANVLHRLRAGRLTLKLDRLGCFARPGGDIWWAGLADCPALLALHRQLNDALQGAGFAMDDRPFRPHITLGREVVLRGAPPAVLPSASMEVARLSLMRSDRAGGQLRYTEVAGLDLPPGQKEDAPCLP